jgi:hypothetical protein
MNIWFTNNLGDPMLADESLARIKALYLSKYSKHKSVKNSNEIAIFFRLESSERVHCEVKIYYSPATIIVAEQLNAIPCKKPCLEGLGLLVGLEESWSILFSDNADTRE